MLLKTIIENKISELMKSISENTSIMENFEREKVIEEITACQTTLETLEKLNINTIIPKFSPDEIVYFLALPDLFGDYLELFVQEGKVCTSMIITHNNGNHVEYMVNKNPSSGYSARFLEENVYTTKEEAEEQRIIKMEKWSKHSPLKRSMTTP